MCILIPFSTIYAQSSGIQMDAALTAFLRDAGPETECDVIISLKSEPRWDVSGLPVSKADRGAVVYHVLSKTAHASQTDLCQELAKWGASYTPFVIVNAVRTRVAAKHLPDIARMPGVERISLNNLVVLESVEFSEPLQLRSAEPEWGIVHIRADSVWKLGFTGQGVVVAGEDTGYDWQHPALHSAYRGNQDGEIKHGYSWYDAIHEIDPANGDSTLSPSNNPCGVDSPEPCDDHGHGTHTMGTMVGEDGENVIGVAPGAKWIACRNMERGVGRPSTYLECLEWFLAPTDENGENPDPSKAPHVINNSWSCTESEGCNPSNFELLRVAVENLRAAGVVVVVSAGNSGSSCGSISTPMAIFEESFTVGAMNINDTIANFSSRGPVMVDSSMRIKPNIAAPGVQVRSAWLNDSYRSLNGTSMAGPHVAGVVALMISANPQLAGQVEVIESIIESTARPIQTEQECSGIPGTENLNNTFGFGMIDALAAVEQALLISSIEEPTQEEGVLMIYPNPVADLLTVASKEITAVDVLRIYALDGRLVFQKSNIELPAQIETHILVNGLYVVKADLLEPVLIQVLR